MHYLCLSAIRQTPLLFLRDKVTVASSWTATAARRKATLPLPSPQLDCQRRNGNVTVHITARLKVCKLEILQLKGDPQQLHRFPYFSRRGRTHTHVKRMGSSYDAVRLSLYIDMYLLLFACRQ